MIRLATKQAQRGVLWSAHKTSVACTARHFSTADDSSTTTNTTSGTNRNPIDIHNRTSVQQRDYEAFLIGLLHPQSIQSHYFALRAFHIELASIHAKDSSVASMRMSWWHDVIQSLYSSSSDDGNNSISPSALAAVRSNPTVAGLSNAIQTHNLTKRFLERMVETRIGDLDKTSGGQFNSMQDMILFFERTNSTFLFLDLECCGVIDEEADKVANCIGISSGIVNSIRSIGCGNIGIPRDLIMKYDLRESDIVDPRRLIAVSDESSSSKSSDDDNINEEDDDDDRKRRDAMRLAVREMAITAGKYLNHARMYQGDVPTEGRSAMLPAVSTLRYLERLEKANYDILEERIRDVENTDSLNGRLWRLGHMMYLGRAWLTGVF